MLQSLASDGPAVSLEGGPPIVSLIVRAELVAAAARIHAADVDAKSRFPAESIDALKAQGLLGAMVPTCLGGESASLSQIADVCFILGRACSSTAMIYAMHQVKAACLIRHNGASPWQLAFLRRVAREQLLLASSTTEGGAGGAVRSSSAPIKHVAGGVHLVRDATVVSYGAEADAIVTTARRNADAAASDQVLAVFTRDSYRLEPIGGWDAMGMRGTCSLAYRLDASGVADQVLPQPYEQIHAQSMTPTAHILWGSVWAGIAAEAVERARLYVRKAASANPDNAPPGSPHLIRAKTTLRTLCNLLAAALAQNEALQHKPSALEALDYQASVSMLKVQASELAVSAVSSALQTIGLSGYRNDSEVSVARMMRDVLAAPLMISNDRILADLKASALMDRGPASISGRPG